MRLRRTANSEGPSVRKRLIDLYRPHGRRLAIAAGLMAVAAAVQGGLVFLIEHVLDDVLIRRDAEALARVPWLFFGLYLVKGAAMAGQGWIVRGAGFEVVRDLRARVFGAMMRQDLSWLRGEAPAVRVSRLTQELEEVEGVGQAFAAAVEKPLTVVVLLGSALAMDWHLTLATLAVLPFVAAAIALFARRQRTTAAARLDASANLAGVAQESLDGLPTLQAFLGESERERVFGEVNERSRAARLAEAMAWIVPGPIIEALAAVGIGLVITYGGHRVVEGELLPGELMAFLVAIGLLNAPLKGLSHMTAHIKRAEAGAKRAFEILDREPAVVGGSRELPMAPCRVELRDVAIDYGDGPVVAGVSFAVEPGEVVAIVGESGGGKSSLLSLIPRFIDSAAGAVLLNGVDSREFSLFSLRRNVALVSQEAFLFDATIADNIRLGDPRASQSAIEEAARRANAHDFISELPEGYDTPVGTGGGRLSVGERQRIGIARAFLSGAPILLLDEVTSALDPSSEELVGSALQELMASRTTFMVTHKVGRVEGANIIVVVDGGRVEVGSHEELMGSSAAYRRLRGGR